MRLPTQHTLIIIASLTLAANAANAQDDGGYYAKIFGGASALQGNDFTLSGSNGSVSYDTGATFGGAIGYDYPGSPFRTELEYAYRTGDASGLPAAVGSGGDFASTTFMLNGYYVFDTSSKLQPYVGLGIGYATEIDFDINGGAAAGEYSDTGFFAYQAMLGVEYPISNRFSLYGEARYFSAGNVELEGPLNSTLSADYDTFDVNVGLAVQF